MNIKYSKKIQSIKAVAALIVLFAFLAMCTPIQGFVVYPPVADAGSDQTALVGETVSFDGSESYALIGTIVSYAWDFGDGGTPGTGVTTTHVYLTAGTYMVTLTVTDTRGATGIDTASVIVTAPNQAPMVSDILDQSVPAGELFTMINLDLHVTDDSVDSEITWTTSGETDLTVAIDADRVATITYPTGWTGSETITFTATDPGGLSGSDDASFTVVNQAPMVSDILDQSVSVGESFATINLDLHVTDDSVDSDITWTASGETDLTVVIDADRVANITYDGWTGSETITFTATDPGGLSGSDDASFTVVGLVDIDIKPESCPNPVNLGKEGLLPVAIIGTGDFDIKDIDPDTILLTREGCELDVAPIRWNYEDVATPYTGTDDCGCHELGGDGCLDMSLKFDTQELVNELNLVEVVGLTIPLTLTGKLRDGTLFEGQDCIWVLETKK